MQNDFHKAADKEYILRPNRSLTPVGKAYFYGSLFLGAGIATYLTVKAGVWPIGVFIDLTALGAAGAMAYTDRTGKEYERILLHDDKLEIRHYKPGFDREKSYELPIFMLRVETQYDYEDRCEKILLKSSGKTIEIGSFMAPDEKKEFAKELENSIRIQLQPPHMKAEP